MKKINKLLLQVKLFFAVLFNKEFEFLKKNSEVAVKVVNALKTTVESPVADIITRLIPGDVDDQIAAKLRLILPQVATNMALAHGIIQQAKAHYEVVGAIVEHLQKLHPDGRKAFWIELAGQINFALADGEISFPEAVALAQVVYVEFKK